MSCHPDAGAAVAGVGASGKTGAGVRQGDTPSGLGLAAAGVLLSGRPCRASVCIHTLQYSPGRRWSGKAAVELHLSGPEWHCIRASGMKLCHCSLLDGTLA